MRAPSIVLYNSLAPGSLEKTVTYAQMAEERGFRSVLVSEAGSDSLALAQHLASVTSRIQVGTCITNIYLRPPLLAALHAMTIDRFAPERLLLGLGTSSEALNKVYGLAMEKPAVALRNYIETVAGLFRGEQEILARMKGMGMVAPRAAHKIPIYVGTASQLCLGVTGELADGCFTSQCAPHGLQEVIGHLTKGAQRAGRSITDISLAPLVHCCVNTDRDVALRAVRRTLAAYGQRPLYTRFFARQGFVKEAEQLAAAAAKKATAAAEAAVSGELAEQVAAMGTAQECQKKVEEFEKAGASFVILFPMAVDGDYDRGVRATLEAFGQ
ncbi:MAG: LLM class flavin-dependent oxidoreductase [Deltaproteobacteria bacterium]|nr:LLM class flavin-dependent oxidoreductase [Deltaproteobacteria bacterium]